MKINLSRRSLRAMFVVARHHDILRQLGLDTIEGVMQFRGELIKDHKGRRDIQRVEARSGEQPVVLYLKRNWKPYRKDGLRSLFTRGKVWSQSRIEWENSLALQRAGVGIAEPIAFGEECGPFWERFSFLITAAANGEMTLDQFIRTNAFGPERRGVFTALAKLVRRMHDAGFASPDLFTRHIFVERGSDPQFCLIDMARLDRRRNLGTNLRARDLAALHVTAPLRFVSDEERKLFLEAYGWNDSLRDRIKTRAEHLLKRRKFADFAAQ